MHKNDGHISQQKKKNEQLAKELLEYHYYSLVPAMPRGLFCPVAEYDE